MIFGGGNILILFLFIGILFITLVVCTDALWTAFFPQYSRTVDAQARRFKKYGRFFYISSNILYFVLMESGCFLLFWIIVRLAHEIDLAILVSFILQFVIAKLLFNKIPKKLFQKYTVEIT